MAAIKRPTAFCLGTRNRWSFPFFKCTKVVRAASQLARGASKVCAFAALLVTYSPGAIMADNHPDTGVSSGWVSIFNGKDLSGWYSFQQSGKNNDPNHIFKIERGMIHILDLPTSQADGQVFGYLSTDKEFSHCRIRAEYKWGQKRFAPNADRARDSGLIYYVVGPDLIWPRSLQLQIMESNTGDMWINGEIRVTTSIENEKPATYAEGFVPHRQAGSSRIVKSADFEDRNGWNTVEVILDGDRVTHLVNGRIVMQAWNLRQTDPKDTAHMIPLDHGRLLLEVEGAEIWFRNVQMQPLPQSARTIASDAAPLSLDSNFGRLLEDPRSRPVLEALLSPDVLDNPLIDQEKSTPAREVLPNIATLEEEQLQALDRALRTLSQGK